MAAIVYLDHRRDVDTMRFLQRLRRCRGRSVVIRHKVLAQRLGISESTARRSIERLVRLGHIVRTYLPRSRGGLLCMYQVSLDVQYRRASTFRRARENEQVMNAPKQSSEGRSSPVFAQGGSRENSNRDDKRTARPSISLDVDEGKLLPGLMETAKAVGIDDRQRGFLLRAALKYGVRAAWRALVIAHEGGYRIADLVRVTWGILKRQYPEGVIT